MGGSGNSETFTIEVVSRFRGACPRASGGTTDLSIDATIGGTLCHAPHPPRPALGVKRSRPRRRRAVLRPCPDRRLYSRHAPGFAAFPVFPHRSFRAPHDVAPRARLAVDGARSGLRAEGSVVPPAGPGREREEERRDVKSVRLPGFRNRPRFWPISRAPGGVRRNPWWVEWKTGERRTRPRRHGPDGGGPESAVCKAFRAGVGVIGVGATG